MSKELAQNSEQTATPVKRGRGRGKPFVAGQPSANPGGRPKADVHVRDLAREQTEQAILTLAEVMLSGSDTARVSAATALLDRGWGKPSQHVDIDGSLTAYDKLSTAELFQRAIAMGVRGLPKPEEP